MPEKNKEEKQNLEIFSNVLKEEESTDAWLMSYADMITLLMCFFVVLISMSVINPVKVEMLSQYFGKTENRMTMSQLDQTIKKFITDENLQTEVKSKLTLRGVEISFKDKLLFDIGKADLKPSVIPVLEKMAVLLKQPEIIDRKISVEGHTDSLPIKSPVYPTNWELSSARAATVVKFFISQGLESKKFESIGYADTKPVNLYTHPVYGQPENRRVVVIISPQLYSEETERNEIQSSLISSIESSEFKNLSSTGIQQSISFQKQKTISVSTSIVSQSQEKYISVNELTQPDQKKLSPKVIDSMTKKRIMEQHYNKGINYLKQGKKQLAMKEFKEILKLDPNHQPSLQRIALLKKEGY